jgi:hypothetical protein
MGPVWSADKRMIKARHATRMITAERDILASVDHPFIAGLQYAFQDDKEVSAPCVGVTSEKGC